MIPAADRWGPFIPELDEPERDPAALSDAARALNAMDATDKRHVWASYARLSRPA